MTVIEALQQIYRTYEGDNDYPDFADSDMQLYFDHLKDALKAWVRKFPQYREVFDYLENAVDGDKVTTPGQTTISAPSNFVKPATFITVGSRNLNYVPPQKMAQKDSEDPTSEYFSIIGFPGAFKIVIHPTPSVIETVNYPYYRTIDEPTGETSQLEISRPYYCIAYTLSKLYLDDPDNKGLVALYRDEMNEEEYQERLELAKVPAGQSNRRGNDSQSNIGFGVLNSDL